MSAPRVWNRGWLRTRVVILGSAMLMASVAHSASSALVLSGGGAKGAYQVGVWKAMTELGIANDVTVFSGTSVGGINAALFARVRTPATIEAFWLESMGGVMVVNSNKVHDVLQEGFDDFGEAVEARNKAVEAKKAMEAQRLGVGVDDLPADMVKEIEKKENAGLWLSTAVQIARRMGERKKKVTDEEDEVEGYVDPERLKQLLETKLPHEWPADTPSVYVTAVEKGVGGRAVFRLNDEPFERKVAMLRATSAIPAAFSSVEIDGKNYYDGGWTEKGGDNVPGDPVIANHPEVETVYVVYLNNRRRLGKDREKPAMYNGRHLVEIIPSKDLYGWFGALNFDVNLAERLIKLGYDDAMKVLANAEK